MQLSAAALTYGGVRTFAASQPSSNNSTWCSLYPEYGVDKHASSKLAGHSWVYERLSIMNYLVQHRDWKPLMYRDPDEFFNSAAEAYETQGKGWVEEESPLVQGASVTPPPSPADDDDDNDDETCDSLPSRSSSDPIKVLVVLGTRPEAIKLVPVIDALRSRPQFETTTVNTGQHLELIESVLSSLNTTIDITLNVMRHPSSEDARLSDPVAAAADQLLQALGQGTPSAPLSALSSRLLASVDHLLEEPFDLVIVQGDTSTALVSALAAFYRKIPVAHVEAGLRTGTRYSPFPEEIHRRLLTSLSTLHFAPTQRDARNILSEGIPSNDALKFNSEQHQDEVDDLPVLRHQDVKVVGNTAIDSLLRMRQLLSDDPNLIPASSSLHTFPSSSKTSPLIVVTAHRRENLGDPLLSICSAISELLTLYPNLHVAWPIHASPSVKNIVVRSLGGVRNLHLLPQLSYSEMVQLMSSSTIVLTDSGGIQEEAPALGKPVLVLRDSTERIEGVAGGSAILVGTDQERIVSTSSQLLDDFLGEQNGIYKQMSAPFFPYGDGTSSEKIVDAIERWASEGL